MKHAIEEIQLDLMINARETRWRDFHAANPHVYALFARFAQQLIDAGRSKLGARLIGERIRWECAIQTTDVEFKINDHYWPFYARLFMTEHPRHAGIFETRGHDQLPAVSRRASG